MTTETLVVKKEWRDLLPPLSKEERAELERSIIAEGCRDPIVVWGSMIVDGHNRYEICHEHGLPYNTVPFYGGPDFDYFTMRAKEEAIKRWMITTQLGRRNLTDEQRTLYLGMLYNSKKGERGEAGLLAAAAVIKKEVSKPSENTENREIDEIFPKSQTATLGKPDAIGKDTATVIAKEHGVSADTVIRAGQYATGLSAIGKISPEVKAKILSGESRKVVTQEQIRKLAGASDAEVAKAVAAIAADRPVAPAKPRSMVETTDVDFKTQQQILRGNSVVEAEPHKLRVAGSTPAPASIPKESADPLRARANREDAEWNDWVGNVDALDTPAVIGRLIDNVPVEELEDAKLKAYYDEICSTDSDLHLHIAGYGDNA